VIGETLFKRFMLVALFMGILSRLFLLGYFPLSFDELIQYDVLNTPKWSQVTEYLRLHERQLPLAYAFYYPIVKLFPHNLYALRIPAVIFSLIGLFLFWKSSLLLFNKEKSLFATSLFSISFLPLAFTHTIRPYPIFLMLSLAGLYFMVRLLREELSLKLLLGFAASLLLLCSVHPFGIVQTGFYGLITSLVIFKRQQLIKKAPFFTLLFWGGGFFALLMGVAYLSENPIFAHPNLHAPDIFKTLGAFVFASSGYINAFLLFLFVFLFHIIKKRIHKQEVLLIGLFLLIGPFIAAYLFSYAFFPVYEIRFFIHTSVFFSLILTHYLYELCFDRIVLKRGLQTVVLGSTILFLCFKPSFFSLENKINIPQVLRDHPQIEGSTVLNCGNCPSFYFDPSRFQCMRGWDFSISSDKNPLNRPDTIFIFKENKNFCERIIPVGWREYSYPGISVFISPRIFPQ
jgi:hypothetical protein